MSPRRIGFGEGDLGLYYFYKRLERRERLDRQPKLVAIALVVSVPVMMTIFGYTVKQQLSTHHVAGLQSTL